MIDRKVLVERGPRRGHTSHLAWNDVSFVTYFFALNLIDSAGQTDCLIDFV